MSFCCINRSTVFNPCDTWGRNSSWDTLQTDGLIENHWALSRPSHTDRWRHCRERLRTFKLPENILLFLSNKLYRFFFTFLGEDKYHQEKLQTCFLLPWTTTLKSLWWFPASLVATHWKCAVSETWARETTSRRPLAAIRKPCPCLSGFPFLNHLLRGRFPDDSVSACMSGSALCMSEWHLTWWQVQVFLWLDIPAPWGC